LAPPDPVTAGSSIPFVRSNGVLEWRAVADDLLYVRGFNGSWHLVRTSVACPRLRNATSIGFVTSGLGELDRFGQILVEEDRCPISSISYANAPPPPKWQRQRE
jgi:hypothetical protein